MAPTNTTHTNVILQKASPCAMYEQNQVAIHYKLHFPYTKAFMEKHVHSEQFYLYCDAQKFEQYIYDTPDFYLQRNCIFLKKHSNNNFFTVQVGAMQNPTICIVIHQLEDLLTQENAIPNLTMEHIGQIHQVTTMRVVRHLFKMHSNSNIELHIDNTQYELGDAHVVCCLSATSPQNQMPFADNSCKPARSKIIEYLHRYEPKVYKELEQKQFVLKKYHDSEHSSDPLVTNFYSEKPRTKPMTRKRFTDANQVMELFNRAKQKYQHRFVQQPDGKYMQ